MANNKFDIKVFTDELNKAFTILKKEQVLEKYMKNILLNYNSIIYIGNITDEPNTYNTIYNYMYGEDNTLCNIVIFETDGFVDSATNIIPSGIHIAYPYLDYSVCIDYKYILNINNSAELLTPTQEFKTINNESILGSGNISVQEPLVSGTNIKTVNEQSLVGSGNISVQEKLVSGSNIKTVNGQTILGNGNVPVQEPLVSGTNIKTVNGQSLLGSENIEISKMVNLGTLPDIGNIPSDKLQELMTLAQNGDLIQATFEFNNAQFITASAYSNGSSMGIVAYDVSNSLNVVNLSINIANTSYTITTISLPTSFKTINGSNITGDGNIVVQEPLVSGTNIKTINNQSLLGEGNIEISGGESDNITIDLGELSTSGTLSSEILTQINNNLTSKSIIFEGTIDGMSITTSNYLNTENVLSLSILVADAGFVYQVVINLADGNYHNYAIELLDSENIKTINNTSLAGVGNIAVQEPLVSGTNIKTINGNSILGSGNIEISGGESNNTIKIIECSPGAQLDADTLQKLQSGKYALYITGYMFYPTSEPKRFNTVPYFNYFGTSIQMGYKSVAINQSNYLETISTYLIDLDIKKTS